MQYDFQRSCRQLAGFVLGLLAALAFSQAASAAGITGIQLLPGNYVTPGSTVTVKVLGSGHCTVFVETNGASDYEGGFGDYQIGPGPLPLSISFPANKVGAFQIAATGADANGNLCVENGNFAVNTMLHVSLVGDPRRIEDKLHRIPKPRIPDPGPGPLRELEPALTPSVQQPSKRSLAPRVRAR